MARARNFAELCALLERAEAALVRTGGVADPEERVRMLRGIYYGTLWSRDFQVERSAFRNVGFTTYTAGSLPADPRPALGAALFSDLQDSQDIRDRGYLLDFGHALCGIEARSNRISREWAIPGQGGTGLEILTWLGDLGGGAANLAWRRSAGARDAARSVSTIFPAGGSDYGAPINLEGDIAGYLIGSSASLAAPTFPRGSAAVTALFRSYLPVSSAGTARYMRRARDFLSIMGGRFDPPPAGRLLNRGDLVGRFRTRIHDFAGTYLLQRYVLGQGPRRERIDAACKHLAGAASEVALSFVVALERAVIASRRPVTAAAPWPAASPPAASCTSQALATAVRARDMSEAIERSLQEGRRTASEWLRRLQEELR